jgi:hypothetical protein
MRALLLLLLTAACTDGKDPATDDTDPVDTEVETDVPSTITVQGTAVDLFSEDTLPAGVCVDLLDPTSMAIGGEPEPIASGVTDASGAFSIAGVDHSSQLGILILTSNCEDGADPFPSISGIAPESYLDLDGGDTLGGQVAFSISGDLAAAIDTSAATAGYVGAPTEDGMIVGLLLDADGEPVAGGTVTCGDCTVYYFDEDGADGLFTTGVSANTSTGPTGRFLVPAAGVGSYGAEDGGAHTWTPFFAGSGPGQAVVIGLKAD